MRAMLFKRVGEPLTLAEVPIPTPQSHEVLIRVLFCGVCRTDLHIVEGDLQNPALPLILGHQIVGTIEKGSLKYPAGTLVGVPWLGGCCHTCEYCLSQRENLCDKAQFTGYLKNGGFAEYCVAAEEFVISLSSKMDPLHTAPLLCAGLIGYRAFKLTGFAKTLGLYGLGSSAHLVCQAASQMGSDVYVFTQEGDLEKQAFARKLGAKWAGGSKEISPVSLDAAILFAPDGSLYPTALCSIKKGGKVISAGIHMSDIPSFPYSLLWGERSISSVANLTKQDAVEWMQLVDKSSIKVEVTVFPLEKANEALLAIREGGLRGSVVLEIG